MVNLAFQRRIEGEKVLLLLHGLQTNKSAFDKFFTSPILAKFSLLAVDLLGFGDSEKPAESDYDLSTQVAAVERLLASLGIHKYSIVGHSLGGMVGTLLSLGDEVDQLVSLEGNLGVQDCGASMMANQLTAEEFTRTYDEWRAKLCASADACERFRGQAMMGTPDFVFRRSSRTVVEFAKSKTLLQIFEVAPETKTLVIGEHSSFASRPKGVALEIIPRAGHFTLLENPQATIQAIAKHLGA